MLNEEGNGVVLSSLYSRERMSIFAKPIKNGKSEYELTEEESKSFQHADYCFAVRFQFAIDIIFDGCLVALVDRKFKVKIGVAENDN